MATADSICLTENTELSEICPMCLEVANDPRLLPCLHSCCRACLDKLFVTAGDGGMCPVCRSVFRLPASGAAGLAKDITKLKGKKELKCSVCEETANERSSVLWCTDCDLGFCGEHTGPHILTSGHVVTRIANGNPSAQTSAEESVNSTRSSPLLCVEHNESLSLFCNVCEVVVCGHCIVIGRHSDHNTRVVPLHTIMERRRENVGRKVEQLRDDVLPANEAILQQAEEVCTQLTEGAEAVRSEILSAGRRAVSTMEAFVQKRLQEVDDLEVSRLKVLEKQKEDLKFQIANAKRAVLYHSALIEQTSSSADTAAVMLALEQRATALCDAAKERVWTSYGKLGFQALSEEDMIKVVEKCAGTVFSLQASAITSVVQGESGRSCRPNEEVKFSLQARDERGRNTIEESDSVCCRVVQSPPSAEALSVNIQYGGGGQYEMKFTPKHEGMYSLEIEVNGTQIPQSLSIMCCSFRFDAELHSDAMRVNDTCLSVTHRGTSNAYLYAVGSQRIESGVCSWQFRVSDGVTADGNRLPNTDHWVGVIDRSTAEQCNVSYKSGYTWSNNGIRWVLRSSTQKLQSPWIKGDVLKFELISSSHKRTLCVTNLRNHETDSIDDLPQRELLPFVCLYRPTSSVQFC